MKKRLFLVSLLTTILVMVFFSPALAKKPKPLVEKYEFPDAYTTPCDGFEAEWDNVAKVTQITFFDDEGNPTRFEASATLFGTITHSENGKSVRDHASNHFKGDLPFPPPDQTSETWAGVRLHLRFPGHSVLVRAGRLVFDENGDVTFASGQADIGEANLKLICDGLESL